MRGYIIKEKVIRQRLIVHTCKHLGIRQFAEGTKTVCERYPIGTQRHPIRVRMTPNRKPFWHVQAFSQDFSQFSLWLLGHPDTAITRHPDKIIARYVGRLHRMITIGFGRNLLFLF